MKTNLDKLRVKCNRIKSANPTNVLNQTVEAIKKDVEKMYPKRHMISPIRQIKQLLKVGK